MEFKARAAIGFFLWSRRGEESCGWYKDGGLMTVARKRFLVVIDGRRRLLDEQMLAA